MKLGVLLLLLYEVASGGKTYAQTADDGQRLQSVKQLYQQHNWDEVLRQAQGPATQPAEFDFYAGLAWSRLEKWKEARDAFSQGAEKVPADARFLTERAGAEYKLGDFRRAKKDLQKSLKLKRGDAYALEFLGAIYVLEGNVEAALNYWNQIEAPRLSAVDVVPHTKLRKELLDRTVTYSPPAMLNVEQYRKTDALLESLEVFPRWRTEIAPAQEVALETGKSGEYKATVHLVERDGWGTSTVDGLVGMLRGLPYYTVYPSYYNLSGEAINLDSLVRWDPEKRRVWTSLEFPIFRQPAKRLRVFIDARNENWNLSRTFLATGPAISDLNVKRVSGGAELRFVPDGNSDWTLGLQGAYRKFTNLPATLPGDAAFVFVNGRSLESWVTVHRVLLRWPERRFALDGTGKIAAGRNYAADLGAFSDFRGELKARWLPKARGDDYEFRGQLRGGWISGQVSLDQLYQLGVERDNDLWLRGHSGTLDGRKGAAPLGRRFVLVNSEISKIVYNSGFVRLQVGPFFDGGAIADPSAEFGSRKWLFDLGLQARIRVLGSVSVVLSYGRDLRDGTGTFYGTSIR